MKKVYSIPLLLSAFIISACKQETPNCSSSDAQKIIFDLMKEELRLSNPNLSSWSRVYDKISFKLNDIRTNKHDKELDNYLCVANLEGKISEQDIQSVLNDIRNEQQAEYEKTEIMLKNAFNEFSLKMDKREKEQISELENEYSSKKNSLSSDKNKAISDSEQKLLENENHYKRMSSQIELDAKNYKRAGASDKEVSESLERNKNELSNNYNHHKNRFNQERDDKVKNIEDNLSILEESYPQDINRVKIYYQQERDKYLSETKEQLDKMVREHEQAIEAYRNQYNSGIKAPVRYKIESSDNGKDFYVTIQ
jgi:lipoprotein